MSYREAQRGAAKRVAALLAKPVDHDDIMDCDKAFDPWDITPCVYGSYSGAFDHVAITVLENLKRAYEGDYDNQTKEGLAHEFYREMLCVAELCEYGTSPRVCFAVHDTFAPLLPELISKWKEYYQAQWGEPYPL